MSKQHDDLAFCEQNMKANQHLGIPKVINMFKKHMKDHGRKNGRWIDQVAHRHRNHYPIANQYLLQPSPPPRGSTDPGVPRPRMPHGAPDIGRYWDHQVAGWLWRHVVDLGRLRNHQKIIKRGARSSELSQTQIPHAKVQLSTFPRSGEFSLSLWSCANHCSPPLLSTINYNGIKHWWLLTINYYSNIKHYQPLFINTN